MARHLSRINELERAITILSSVLDRGFLWATAIARDPWFSSLRASIRYVDLLRNAEQKRDAVHAAFLAAGGDQLLAPT
jgi:hypothetical protein